MEIISYFGGITQLLTSWDEIRPKNGIPNQILVNSIKSAFSFEYVSVSPEAPKVGISLPIFGQGLFSLNGIQIPINALDFQPDRIVAVCPTTEQSDEFINFLIAFLVDNIGFRLPKKGRNCQYQSTIISDIGVSFAETLGKWQKITDFYNQLGDHNNEKIIPLSLRFGLAGTQPTDSEFSIEKRFSAPEGENWIFTQANLKTSDHEKLLNFIASQFLK